MERSAREASEAMFSNIIATAEEELRVKFVEEERNRRERKRERDKVEAEIAGKLHDDARLLTLRWQSQERRRREAATQGKRERALCGRKVWRQALKSCCHEQSIWRPYLSYVTSPGGGQTDRQTDRDAMPAPAAVFGETVSTFSRFWCLDLHEAGGFGVRRRLKRDAQGSAHEQSAYLKFLGVNVPVREDTPAAAGTGTLHVVADAREDALEHGLLGLNADELMGASHTYSQASGGASMEGPWGGGERDKSQIGVECEMVTSSCTVVGCLLVSTSAISFVVKRAKNGDETFSTAYALFFSVLWLHDCGCDA